MLSAPVMRRNAAPGIIRILDDRRAAFGNVLDLENEAFRQNPENDKLAPPTGLIRLTSQAGMQGRDQRLNPRARDAMGKIDQLPDPVRRSGEQGIEH